MVEGYQKYPNNINAEKKRKKLIQIRSGKHRLERVSLRLAKMQEEALSLMLKARNLMLLNVDYLKQYVFYCL